MLSVAFVGNIRVKETNMAQVNISYDLQLDIAVYKFQGELAHSDIRDAITKYYSGNLTKYTIWDFSGTDVHNIRNSELLQVGNQVALAGKARNNCYDVIIVSDIIKYGLARIYAGYAETIQKNPMALKTMVFRDKEHAMDWIKANEKFSKSNKNI